MKICSIRIKNYQQFKDVTLDFTDPKTKEPVDKICFIGKNGTGKSTLLELINVTVKDLLNVKSQIRGFDHTICIKMVLNKAKVFCFIHFHGVYFFEERIYKDYPLWFEQLNEVLNITRQLYEPFREYLYRQTANGRELRLENNSTDLLINVKAESDINVHLALSDVPKTDLNAALQLFDDFPFYHEVSNATVSDFWKVLIYHIKKREEERELFENRKENLEKTKRELIEEFDKLQPKILDELATLWNKILEKAGLCFDVERAKSPVQLNDNLKAYIATKEGRQTIEYNRLSTGIRNFIFRVGHIYSLYFNRNIERGFVLMDEPENSLYPDFLYSLINVYENIWHREGKASTTQFFVATHSPIIAAQFEPHERIILDWDAAGGVIAQKGKAPVGDDPNDVLHQDFGLDSLMGEKGVEQWNEYVRMKKDLARATDEKEKEELMEKILEIGRTYNF